MDLMMIKKNSLMMRKRMRASTVELTENVRNSIAQRNEVKERNLPAFERRRGYMEESKEGLRSKELKKFRLYGFRIRQTISQDGHPDDIIVESIFDNSISLDTCKWSMQMSHANDPPFACKWAFHLHANGHFICMQMAVSFACK